MDSPKTKVLVVEDSPVVQLLLVHLLRSDPQFEVIGTANNGEEAIAFVAHTRPDVILMDVHMPKMDGIEATRRIMETTPVPIVMASASLQADEVPLTFRALEAGALAFVDKAARMGSPEFETLAKQLKQTLKLMSEVHVVRRWNRGTLGNATAAAVDSTLRAKCRVPSAKIVAIGVSTGGPPVLQTILSGLPRNFPVPLLVVQHISPGFVHGLAEWLSASTGIHSHVPAHGDTPVPGHAYLAPDDFHMGLERSGRILLSKAEPEGGLRPSVGFLFRSVAETLGRQAVGVLLTGMGRDGAEELLAMKRNGSLTIVQDKETSVVHGMPGEAIALGAATVVLPPTQIAAALSGLGCAFGGVEGSPRR